MEDETYQQLLTEREANMVFNRGLQTAVFILEKAESLSPGGRRHLLESLKKNISENEGVYSAKLLKCISNNFQ